MLAVSRRVLTQLRHDPRTLGLLFVVPPVLITVLKYVVQNTWTFNHLAPTLLGIFPMVMMFLVTSIATLRERINGTLERLTTMPLGKVDFVLGYAVAFSAVAFVQAIITSSVLLGVLRVTVAGGTILTIVGALLAAFLGTALGLFVSAFAQSEFQAVQFMPAVIFPQLLVCGLLVPRAQMSTVLQHVADVLPLTYSVDAMQRVAVSSHWTTGITHDFLIVAAFGLIALLLGSLTIRRQE